MQADDSGLSWGGTRSCVTGGAFALVGDTVVTQERDGRVCTRRCDRLSPPRIPDEGEVVVMAKKKSKKKDKKGKKKKK